MDVIRFLLTIPAAALVLLLLYLDTSYIYACSCVLPRPPLEALERADAVFAGDVVSISESKGMFGSWLASSADPVTVEFRVNSVWKGEIHETLFMQTAWSSASCGFEFVQGEQYIVYAREGWVSLCSRTKNIDKAKEDLMALGEGSAPAPNVKRKESLLLTPVGVGVAVIGLAGVAMAFVLWRRQQSHR
ncbi:MAG: hypothetical protein OXI16_00030 [Chloroflexota bacterium]|nr:hypothetical protein [Chloroflexota bacterium]